MHKAQRKNMLNASRLSRRASDDGLAKFPAAIMIAGAAGKIEDFFGTLKARHR
jgi:hypothetical protein